MVGFRTRTNSNRRNGFTMIEVMVVIVILAILIGLLLPALSSARLRVRQTQVRTEISQLENAIGNFKNRFGVEPPSRITLWEDPTANNGCATSTPNQNAIESLAILRQMWPAFDATASTLRDWDGDGTATGGPFTLTQGECLVFFLGGMPTSSSVGGTNLFTLSGFSKNPADPTIKGGTREGPFYEFKNDRFTDFGTTGFPEYKDPLPGQTQPYLYYSSYDGSGYREMFKNVTPDYFATVASGLPILAYRQGSIVATPASTATALPTQTSPFKSKSFQIISPGLDHKYGPGGPYVAGSKDPLPAWDSNSFNSSDGSTSVIWFGPVTSGTTPIRVTVTAADREAERDNITNFSTALLAP